MQHFGQQQPEIFHKKVISLSDVIDGVVVDKRGIRTSYPEVKKLFDLKGDDSLPVLVMVGVKTNDTASVSPNPNMFQATPQYPQANASVAIGTENSLSAGKMIMVYSEGMGYYPGMGQMPQAGFQQFQSQALTIFESFVQRWKMAQHNNGQNTGWT